MGQVREVFRGSTRKDHRDTRPFRLVADERPELVEGPAGEHSAPAARNRDPQPNARKVFQGDRLLRVFRLRNELFADPVVHVLGKPGFLAGKLLELPLGSPGALGLELGPEPPVTVTDVVHHAGGVDHAVGVHGDVLDAEIDTESILSNDLGKGFYCTGWQEVKLPPGEHQVGFAFTGFEKFPLPVAANEWDSDTAGGGPDGYGGVCQAPGKDPIVVGNGAGRLETAFGLSVQFVGVGDLGDRPDGRLGGKAKAGTNVFVAEVVQVVLSEGLGRPR